MDRDFEIGDKKFKLSKINALKQFHIVRRIAPILGELAPNMPDIAKSMKKELSEEEQLEQMAKFLGPVISGMSKLSDKDSTFVLTSLLASVEMKQESGNWARLAMDEQLMFDDLGLPILLQAAAKAFAFNMSGFFAVLPQVS